MENTKSNSNSSKTRKVQRIIKTKKNEPYKLLGENYGHAIAIKLENNEWAVGYCNQRLGKETFKTVQELKDDMNKKPYKYLPLMALLYADAIKKLSNEVKE